MKIFGVMLLLVGTLSGVHVNAQPGYASWVYTDTNYATAFNGNINFNLGTQPGVPGMNFPVITPNNVYGISPSIPKIGLLYQRLIFASGQLTWFVGTPDATRELAFDASPWGLGWSGFVPAFGYYVSSPYGDPLCDMYSINNLTVTISDSRGALNAHTQIGVVDFTVNGNSVSLSAIGGGGNSTCLDMTQYPSFYDGANNDMCITGDYNDTSVASQVWSIDDPTPLQSGSWYVDYYIAHTCTEAAPFACRSIDRVIDVSIKVGCGPQV